MSWVYTYSGRRAGPDYDAPTIQDVGTALGRICRFAGNGVRFWPVLLHSMAVADLVPERLQAAALLHDSTESVMGDVPRPFKNDEYKRQEHRMRNRIFSAFGVKDLTDADEKLIKAADDEAGMAAEAWTTGAQALRPDYERSRFAEDRIRHYLKTYPSFDDYLRPDGRAVMDFVSRVYDSLSN